jgi:16S rRNA (guanine1516-N2)-methyltransferase
MTSRESDNKPQTRVVIACDEDSMGGDRARLLAAQLGLPCIAANDACADADFVLSMRDGKLALRDCEHPRMKPFAVDFHLKPDERLRRQPLARALGKTSWTVIDATAGLGQDALRMAAWGHEVLALERSPVIAALLDDAVRRASQDIELARVLGDRLRVECADARTVLAQGADVDVVYLDPMFPEKRRRSALARKEMRVVRALVGEDEDAVELLAIARRCARRRVVVKRPSHAGPLVEQPDFSQAGKLVRYDVYLTSGNDPANHERDY